MIGKQTFERKRVCVKAKPDSKVPCEGEAVETQMIDRPACIPDKTLCEDCKKSEGQKSHAKAQLPVEVGSIGPTTEARYDAPPQEGGQRKLNAAQGDEGIANGSNEILEQQDAGQDQEELYEDDDAVS